MRLLKPFGAGGRTRQCGYDLPLLLGHLDGLAFDEEDNVVGTAGVKAKRLDKVLAAIALLQDAAEMGGESY
jgi:hypothetical protein